MNSFQNLLLLQNFYRLRAMGFEYCDSFSINQNSSYDKPQNMNEIKRDILSCHLCDLSKSRSQSMSGYGDPNADLMIIDYSVSSYEDSTNSYYCGKSGEMLKDMVEKVLNLKVEEIYFTHTTKCKPLNSNTPSNSEWDSCKSYLFAQIDSIKPKVIVTLGKDAYAKVTSENENFQSVRGHVIDFKDYKLIPMYHPNHLLRNPDDKKIAFIDLKTIKSCI